MVILWVKGAAESNRWREEERLEGKHPAVVTCLNAPAAGTGICSYRSLGTLSERCREGGRQLCPLATKV